jgi:hypothetical protein
MTDSTEITKYTDNPGSLIEYVKRTGDWDVYAAFLEFLRTIEEKVETYYDAVLKPGYEIWKPSEHEGEDFIQFVFRRAHLSPTTVDRHISVSKMYDVVPAEYRKDIEAQDFKQKIYIANAVEQGYEIKHEQWEELTHLTEYQQTSDYISVKIKDEEHRKNFLRFMVDEDFETNRIIWVQTNEGTFVWARVEDNPNPHIAPIIEKATARAKSKLNVSRKVRY